MPSVPATITALIAFLLLVCALVLFAWNGTQAQDPSEKFPSELSHPSFFHLVANAKKYHGRRVRVSGFLIVEFEGDAIYVSREHGEYSMSENGLWVSFDRARTKSGEKLDPSQFHKKWVEIEGTFNANNRGHFSGWQGAVQQIQSIRELRK